MKYIKLFISVSVTFLAGILGSIFTATAIDTWYVNLNKPAFTPPNSVFGPVWSFIYLLMGISFFLVWIKKPANKNVYFFYGTNLLLNFLWSFIFFGMKLPYLALLDIAILWFSIILLINMFRRYSKTAAYMLVPYLMWVTFASILNFYIAILN